MTRRTDTETEKQICRLYQEEKISTVKLSKQFALNCTTVCDILKRHNIKIRDQKESQSKKISPSKLLEAAEEYKAGKSLKTIAAQLNTTRRSLTKALVEAGVVLRSNYSERQKYQVKPEGQGSLSALEKEKARKYAATRRASHPEFAIKNRQYAALWRKANPEKSKQHERDRRAREMGAQGSHTHEEILSLYSQQNECCFYCHAPVPWDKKHVEHKIPLSRGGSNFADNLAISCASCNLSKGKKTHKEFSVGEAWCPPVGVRYYPHINCSSLFRDRVGQ